MSNPRVPSRHPTVAVLLPVYNAERFLDDAIGSIRRQTFTDLEIITIDDGSTDRSRAILESHAGDDPRVRVTSRENRGLVSTLNEMIAMTAAPLLARMDADDIAMPDRLDRQVRHLKTNRGTVCLGGGVQLISEHGSPLLSPKPLTGSGAVEAAALSGRTPISHPAAVMRRSAVLRVGGYHHAAYPAEDLDLFLRLSEVGAIDNLPETVLKYRMHGQSISVTRSDDQLRQMRRVCEAAWARRGITGEFRGHIEAKPSADTQRVCPIAANPTAAALASGFEADPAGTGPADRNRSSAGQS